MNENAEQLYKEHLDEMFSIHPDGYYTEERTNRILERLLKILPNNGKLYKYRSIEGKAFDNAYDSLENGYLYLATANTLNDDSDTTINYQADTTFVEVANYLFQRPDLLLRKRIESPECGVEIFESSQYSQIFEDIVLLYDKSTGQLNYLKALEYLQNMGFRLQDAEKFIDTIQNGVKEYCIENKDAIKNIAKEHLHYNEKIKEIAHVFSMSEDFDNDTMWAYYSDSNNGFCIEYDFNLAKNHPLSEKVVLINLFRSEYSDKQEPFSFLPVMNWYYEDQSNDEKAGNVNKYILKYLLTKKRCWQHEKEWRLLVSHIPNKFYADIVSGIIIDERILDIENAENAKKLIQLAQKKNWTVTVRQKNITGTKHEYIPFEKENQNAKL